MSYMAPVQKTVLVDATPLRTGSGFRGIGRFTYDLLYGLAATRGEWSHELSIVALSDLGLGPRFTITADLAAAADEALAERGALGDRMNARRLMWLGPAALAAKASLVHMPEALGVPLVLPVPRVITCHDVIPLVYPQHYLGRGVLGAVNHRVRLAKDLLRYRLATRVVAISERSKRDIVDLLGVLPARVDVVPNGVDLTRFDAPPRGASDAEKLRALGVGSRPFAVYVGYGDYRKNIPTMLAALTEARRTADIELVWAGKLPPKLLDKMRDAARREGVEESVRFLGFVPEDALPALYRAAVAHIFLSRLEGFGLTVVEAMASSCPVIVARGSSADEVAGDAGIIVDPDDARGAGSALARLAQDAAAREAWAARGRERAKAFGREATARGYVASFLRALA